MHSYGTHIRIGSNIVIEIGQCAHSLPPYYYVTQGEFWDFFFRNRFLRAIKKFLKCQYCQTANTRSITLTNEKEQFIAGLQQVQDL